MYDDLFYKRLIQLKNQKNVSSRDMSLSLGQSESYINKIENKKSLPSMTGFFYICEYLNIHPKEFFDEGIENPVLISEFLKELNRLSSEQISNLLAVAKDIGIKK